MKRLLMMVFVASALLGANAQEQPGSFSVTPQVGVTLADLTHFDWAEGIPLIDYTGSLHSRYKAGFLGGAQVEYQVTPVLSASAGLVYSLMGTRYADFMVDNGDGTAMGVSDMHVDLHYLNVPLMLNAYVAQGLALKAGLEVGILLDGRMKSDETSVTIDPENGAKTYGIVTEVNEKWKNMKGVALSLPVGVSYEYERVVLDARYHLGLTKVCEGFDWRNSAFTITVGYKINLNGNQ